MKFSRALLLSVVFMFVALIEVNNAGLLDMLLSSGAGKKILPYLSHIPKAFPLLKGKVKSQECRDRSSDALKRTTEVLKMKDQMDMNKKSDQMKALSVICPLEKKCFLEYVEAVIPMLDSPLVKKVLPGLDATMLTTYAGPVFDFACKGKEQPKEDL